MTNPFTEIYKKLPTSTLLDMIQNHTDYQPSAIEAAKLELAGREDIEAAKHELNEKNNDADKKVEAARQKTKSDKRKNI